MTDIVFRPIGVIRSPFQNKEGMPIQPAGAAGIRGTVEMDTALVEGLADLDGFSHLILLYHFHRSSGYDLTVVPFLDKTARGLFSTRAPRRPNPIGLSVVRLERIEGTMLHILDVDVLDNTPLIDLKPYVPKFDSHPDAKAGWLAQAAQKVESTRSDGRFKV